MASGWGIGSLWGGNAAKKKDTTKNAILGLRSTLDMLSKREKHLQNQMDEQDAIARKNVSTNKGLAKAALRRKKAHEQALEQTSAQMMTLEKEISSIESANINKETLDAMTNASKAMKTIHGGLTVDKVDQVMEDLREQHAVGEEIADALAQGATSTAIDEDELDEELAELQQEQLDEKMLKTGSVPISDQIQRVPNVPNAPIRGRAAAEEEDEEEELRKLQAEMAMYTGISLEVLRQPGLPRSALDRSGLSYQAADGRAYMHPDPTSPSTHILSLLPTCPPSPHLAIGTTSTIPPTPESLTESPAFLNIVHETLRKHAHSDPEVIAQAAMYSSQAGSALGSGGVFSPSKAPPRRRGKGSQASMSKPSLSGHVSEAQGGMGGAGKGGYIHVSDQRQPPDFGRVAWPEDIFGSLELDAKGEFVDGHGRYQEAGTYRICTREGVLGLSAYLWGKVVERLREMEKEGKETGKS
ncbi:hypothetical protein B0A48_18178 [Cryoendolithus antarcticus]|uniref:Vacuolar-sorting protein SNF7 n=1 Tax=Cryoendolithus antarcticus TaxID=1507870 RepID=A0A1V8S8S3_9PEZI|nr:hypothetical protein B0A48_18178 [Cryoendolithus antarcticus]